MSRKHDIVIGIDPDLEKNGVAMLVEGELMSLQNLPFMKLMEYCQHEEWLSANSGSSLVFVVEDVEYNKPVFNRRLSPKQNLKVAQNVGMVKGVARMIVQFLEASDMRYIKVPPLKGHLKKAKNDRQYFNQLTGWQKSSNQDNRDAALLAKYGLPAHVYVPRPSEVPH